MYRYVKSLKTAVKLRRQPGKVKSGHPRHRVRLRDTTIEERKYAAVTMLTLSNEIRCSGPDVIASMSGSGSQSTGGYGFDPLNIITASPCG